MRRLSAAFSGVTLNQTRGGVTNIQVVCGYNEKQKKDCTERQGQHFPALKKETGVKSRLRYKTQDVVMSTNSNVLGQITGKEKAFIF